MSELLFDGKWFSGLKKTKEKHKDNNYLYPRSYQTDYAIKSLNKNTLFIGTTACGKSIPIIMSSYEEAIKFEKKQIITVPQKSIGKGFSRLYNIKCNKLSKNPLNAHIIDDLCNGNGDQETKTKHLINFLEKDSSNRPPEDLIIIVTHSTLANTFNHLKETKKLSFFKNTHIWIDEGHHSYYDEDEEIETMNCLGKITRHFIKYKNSYNLNFSIITATPFRFGGENIVPRGFEFDYTERVSYLKYLGYTNWFRGVNIKLVLEEKEYVDTIKEIFKKEKKKKTIISIPHVNSVSHLKNKNKYESVEEIRNIIPKDLNVVDLVTENIRSKGMEEIEEHPSKVDVVINIRAFGEGADWPNAERLIICGNRCSLGSIIQNIGRVQRDFKGKEKSEVIIIIPNLDIKKYKKDPIKYRHIYNDNLKLIGRILLFCDDYYHINNKLKKPIIELLEEKNLNKLYNDTFKDFLKLIDTKDNYTNENIKILLKKNLKKFNIEDDETVLYYFKKFLKLYFFCPPINSKDKEKKKTIIKKLKQKGMEIDDLTFDLIDEIFEPEDTLGFFKVLSSKLIGVDTLTLLRRKTIDIRLEEIEKWVYDNNDLPRSGINGDNLFQEEVQKQEESRIH